MMRRALLQSCSPTCARALVTSAVRARPGLGFSTRHLSSSLGKDENKTHAATLGIQGFSGFKSAEKALKYQSFQPEVDSELTELLKGMASATAEDVGAGVRAIRLGKGAKFLSGKEPAGSTIYERSFYPRLVSAIRGLFLRVILISNPGTGKSAFQFYLLARYLSPALFKDNDVPPSKTIKFGPTKGSEAPKVVIRHLPTVCMEVWFLEQQVVHVIEPGKVSMSVLRCFDPETAMYFFEPGKTKGIEPYADDNILAIPTLVTVSPDPSRYNQTGKVSNMAYMPVFTKDELLAIGRDMRGQPGFSEELRELYTDEGIGSRFDVFNGIIRHVLPQSQDGLMNSHRKRKEATETVNAQNFLYGTIENGMMSHYLGVYDVERDKNGNHNFTSYTLKSAAPDVETILEQRMKKISLMEKIEVMQRFSSFGMNKFDAVPLVYENLVAEHLTSVRGVSWMQRSVLIEGSSGKSKGKGEHKGEGEPLLPLSVRLAKPESGTVPRFADMKPNVLYRSATKNFPFCDMLYLAESGEKKKLVCVQVSIEGSGKRKVEPGPFQEFCERLGWGPTPTAEQLALIEYVYCPRPALADKAAVTFDDGMGISEYSVWHVDPNFAAKMTTTGNDETE